MPFGFVGLTDGHLRIPKFGSSQSGQRVIPVNDVPPGAEAKPRDEGKVRFVVLFSTNAPPVNRWLCQPVVVFNIKLIR